MKISRNLSEIGQKQFYGAGQVKKEKGEPDRVTLGSSDNETPDFINDGKQLAHMAKTKKHNKLDKSMILAAGAIGATVGFFVVAAVSSAICGAVGAVYMLVGGAVAGGAIGSGLGWFSAKKDVSGSEHNSSSGNSSDDLLKVSMASLALSTGNTSLLAI